MGLTESKYLNDSDISDDDLYEDCEEHLDGSLLNVPSSAMELSFSNTMDAASGSAPTMKQEITLNLLRVFERDLLAQYELISLIFLLYNNVHSALADIRKLIHHGSQDILYKWGESEMRRNPLWNYKLIEALCIIQNYEILSSLGYHKSELISMFLPSRSEISNSISKLRKTLYLIAEGLNQNQATELIGKMTEKLRIMNSPNNFDYNSDCLELYFIYWEVAELDFKDLKTILKQMDVDLYVSNLEKVIPDTNVGEVVEPGPSSSNRGNIARDNTNIISASVDDLYQSNNSENVTRLDDTKYKINPDQPGIVLIINQESFYTEPNKKYAHLLHETKDEQQLQTRDGTARDRDRLKDLFEKMNFTVRPYDNLIHLRMIKEIEAAVDAVTDEISSIIICILSHGENGVLYGSNSCKVEVSQIEGIMCKRNKKLEGKPKVLILQSCQGNKCQIVEEENEELANTTDGPTRSRRTADMLTFWATIPGFAAIRNMYRGSWFIQALCDQIEKYQTQYHFLDICIRANNQVTRQEWKQTTGINTMTPMVNTTLTRDFYLPPFRY